MFKSYLNAILPDGTRKNVRVVGLDDATLAGGPLKMLEGSMQDLRRDRAVIMNIKDASDTFMLNRLDPPRPLRVGDRLSINDNEAEIVGTYQATPEFFWEPVLYTTYSRAVFMSPRERRSLMYILVKVADGADVPAVQQRISSIPGLRALTNEQFESQTTWWIITKTGILVNFGMTIALGFIVGVLVSAQTLYTFVLENTRHFAALKAMGATNATMIRMVALQVLVVGLIGFGVGLGGAVATGIAFRNIGLQFAMPWQVPVGGLAAILVCCVIAGVLSLLRVLRLEPAIVFKG
jgi:putative ABC transport system permease protein